MICELAGAVTLQPGEPFDALLRRFKRGVDLAGVLRDYRRQRWFIPNHERLRAKRRRARRRAARAREAGR
jgi:ribosomal protein S21